MNPILVAIALLAAGWAWMNRDEEDTPEPTPKPEPDSKPKPAVLKPVPVVPATPATPIPATPAPPIAPSTSPPPGSGYDEDLYPNTKAVRSGLKFLGYPVHNLSSEAIPDADVKSFQSDYNEASLLGFADADGWLSEDGVPGENTLRALKIAVSGTDGLDIGDIVRGYQWSQEFGL